MNALTILFIPDRFMDYRLWSDIPDRLRGRAQVIHYDQHEQIPWTADNGEFVDAARRLAVDDSFQVVAAAGHAARFAFALAEAGLAKGLVLFQPEVDRHLDDVRADTSGLDLDQIVEDATSAFQPAVGAISDPDPGRRRDVLLTLIRDYAGRDLEPAELELAVGMYSDHADELFTELQAFAADEADGRAEPDRPWMQRPWIDRLGELTVPVTVVVPPRGRPIGDAIARRARHAEIVVAAGSAGLAPADDRARAAEALLRMLDRTN
jgi:hypothetical protein